VSMDGSFDPPPWDMQLLADITLKYRDKNRIADFPSLALLLRTIQMLRLRRAGASDEELALALTAPDRLRVLGKEPPAPRKGKPLRILVFGATPELEILAKANRGGIIDVVSRMEAPVNSARLQ